MINLQDFCESNHPGLRIPFSQGGYIYASDGHMIIRIAGIGEVNKLAPNAMEIPLEPDSDGEWIDINSLVFPDKERCHPCRGTGRSKICEECDGDGEIELYNSFNTYEAECKSCNGRGSTSGGDGICVYCDGNGEVYDDYAKIAIGDVTIPAKRARLCLGLPNAKIFSTCNKSNVVPLKFDGGCGGIMRMITDGD